MEALFRYGMADADEVLRRAASVRSELVDVDTLCGRVTSTSRRARAAADEGSPFEGG